MLRSARISLMVVGSLLSLSACNSDPTVTDPPDQFVWEVHNIVSNGAVADQNFSAVAYIVAVGGLVDTGIRISNAEFETEYGWLIRAGVCGSNGALLSSDPSAFPIVTIASNGVGEVAKALGGFLEGTEELHVEIYLDPLGAEPTLVGCGQMIIVDGLPSF